MKKIKNMTAAEAKQAFTKWEAKHPRHDDFDFNAAQIGNYKELFRQADRESIIDLIYDLFNYGFMAGYKQSEAEQKATIDKHVKTICTVNFWNLSIICLLGTEQNISIA